MLIRATKGSKCKWSFITSVLTIGLLTISIVLGDTRTASALPLHRVLAIPAFARKYGLPCSACHEAWPKLNNFGQVFRDNGYQLGNDRDSPIWQNPAYWPMTLRITPQWHRESTEKVAVDIVPGDPTQGQVERKVTTHGFDLSGVDIWTAGTLFKNISFSLLPSSDSTGAFHFENAFVRFDNILNSRWVNVKVGKFELDNMISEKRMLFLSGNGGFFQTYHFVPVGNPFYGAPADVNDFGIGDNQLGIELAGHAANSYTRYTISLLSSNSGNVNLPNRTYDGFITFSQAFPVRRLGLQRFGGFLYVGQRPTFAQSSGGAPTGIGLGNRSFYRAGFAGDWYIGKLDFSTVYLRGSDNVFLGTGTAANAPLPVGAQGPTWNGGFIETHYTVNTKLVLLHRYELIRMSRQALASNPSDLGNIDAVSFGYRWYPIMFSRAGLAWHNEYSLVRTRKGSPLTGTDFWSNSLLLGFDFDF